MTAASDTTPFYFKDCALSSIATGEKAQNLNELYDILTIIHPGCIYNHFWGSRIRPHHEVQEYHNDFAMWAYRSLHDQTLAERLAIIDPTDFDNLEHLRREVLTTIEDRLDETDQVPWLPKARHFYFIRSQIVIFDTNYSITKPEELIQVLPKVSPSSIYYHFIDAFRRTPKGLDDFSAWLKGFEGKYEGIIQQLREIDFYFISLTELQNTLIDIFTAHFLQKRESEGKNPT